MGLPSMLDLPPDPEPEPPAAMTAPERIRAAAEERAHLLRKIADTQHAGPALDQTLPQIIDLNHKLDAARKLVASLKATKDEKEEAVDRLRNHSHMRRLLQRDKAQAQLKKDEADYREALDWHDKAEVKMQLINKDLVTLQAQRDKLRAAAKEHRAAVNRLDDLYASVFDGPSPEMPEEDALEEAVQNAQKVLDEIQGRLSHAAAVYNHVVSAHMRTRNALDEVSAALKFSAGDIVAVGGSTYETGVGRHTSTASARADRAERYALDRAQSYLAEAEHFMALAQQMDSNVGGFARPSVTDSRHGLANHLDEMLDNPLTDYWFHTKIEASLDSVAAAEPLIRAEAERAEQRRVAIEEEKKPAEAALKEGRERLLDFRQDLFERVLRAQAGQAEEPLPGYA